MIYIHKKHNTSLAQGVPKKRTGYKQSVKEPNQNTAGIIRYPNKATGSTATVDSHTQKRHY